jgi:hypothetical protein
MKELRGACIIGQSGGPTSVINASAYGVIDTALKSGAITQVLGAEHGIKGVLANVGPFMRLVDHDLEDMWPADENDRSRDQDEVNGLFDQILTVASECA